MESGQIPVAHVFFGGLDECELFLGVVDEGAELLFLDLAQGVAEYFVDFALDGARGVFQYVAESFVLAVDVAEEVFRPLGEVEYGRQVDYFGAGRCDGRELVAEQSQVFEIAVNLFG